MDAIQDTTIDGFVALNKFLCRIVATKVLAYVVHLLLLIIWQLQKKFQRRFTNYLDSLVTLHHKGLSKLFVAVDEIQQPCKFSQLFDRLVLVLR